MKTSIMLAAAMGLIGVGVCSAAGLAETVTVVKGKIIYTMGPAGKISDGAVVVRDGKIASVGPAAGLVIPPGATVVEVAVVLPGLIDAHSTVGLSGIYNQKHDSDQLESSSAIQPELRALDAYNANEQLVDWVRSFGVTTLHTGHAPGQLISGQTFIVKTTGKTVKDALVKEAFAVAGTLGPSATRGASPGTRAKQISMLREQFIKAREYADRRAKEAKGEVAPAHLADAKQEEGAEALSGGKEKKRRGGRDLRLEALASILDGTMPLMITAQKQQDIEAALRLAEEFKFRLILDGAAEAQGMIDQIVAAKVSVIIHPTMTRAFGETENLSMETAGKLVAAGVPVSFGAGYEAYVPKTRVVLLEAAIAAANGLPMEKALASLTIEPARLLGIEAAVGSIEVGKDGDLALYDGDPLEYTTHCVGTFIGGVRVSEVRR